MACYQGLHCAQKNNTFEIPTSDPLNDYCKGVIKNTCTYCMKESSLDIMSRNM